EPIPGYYPPVIDERTWQQARDALRQRRHRQGRVGGRVASLFTGLLKDARTHSRMYLKWDAWKQKAGWAKRRVLMPAPSLEGGTARVSFPYDVFEAAMLDKLEEINPADVLGEEPES